MSPCIVQSWKSEDIAVRCPPSSVPRLLSWVLGVGLIGLVVAGCEQPQKQAPRPAAAQHGTTVEDLALRLGLRMEERGEGFVVLKNAANTVILFTQTGGRFFVNGTPRGTVGTIQKQGTAVYVSDSLAAEIRQYLHSATPAPQPPVTIPPAPHKTMKGLVVIDAGHGGHDPGTISSNGIQEKSINLQVATRVANLLQQKGIGVVMTRQDDRYPELEERADIANRRNADLFVSIHCDSNPDHGRQGYTVYVAKGASSEANHAAGEINQALAATGTESHGIHEAVYKVLVNTTGPAVLVEIGYLSNVQDCARLRDGAHQNRLAQAIANGILSSLR